MAVRLRRSLPLEQLYQWFFQCISYFMQRVEGWIGIAAFDALDRLGVFHASAGKINLLPPFFLSKVDDPFSDFPR